MAKDLLSIQGLDVHYGRIHALKHVDLELRAGEIVAVLGANGAGKTTLLKTVIGALRPSAGAIVLDGRNIERSESPQRVASGLSIVPEGRQILVSLTVEENLLLGAVARPDRSGMGEDLQRIYERFPNLAERRHMEARVLSGGEQQMLAIGRALMARPRLMLLDEPSLGLSPVYVQRIYRLLRDLNTQGLSMLVVEQNVAMVLSIASRAYVLELGRIVAQGLPGELLKSAMLQEAYLGR
jgi:branched-chain amino acid transport system ATP-binding protein